MEHPELDEADKRSEELIGLGTACWRFFSVVGDTLAGRRLFSTVEGRFGFGPAETRNQDVICILNHAKSAHVLRKTKDDAYTNREVYAVVGQAYVHGMMDGEVEELGVEDMDIVLV
jgi:hypothetical protein